MARIKTSVLIRPFSECVWLEDVVWGGGVISRLEQSVIMHFCISNNRCSEIVMRPPSLQSNCVRMLQLSAEPACADGRRQLYDSILARMGSCLGDTWVIMKKISNLWYQL